MPEPRRATLGLAALGMLALAGSLLGGRAQSQALVDPTRPASVRDAAASIGEGPESIAGDGLGPLSLTAILISDERRVATIDAVTVREGDSVDGLTVVEIRPFSVRVAGEEGEQTLWLAGSPVKRPAEDQEP